MTFDRLDNPTPFKGDARFRTEVLQAGRRRLRRRRVVVTVCSSLLLISIVGAVSSIAWLQSRVGDIERVEIAGNVLEPVGDEPAINVLLIGSDADLHADYTNASARADLVMVARLDQSTGTIRVLSLPRDLFLPGPPGSLPSTKLSATLQDGPTAAVVAVEDVLNIEIHHYVQLELSGFADLVDQIGGIAIQPSHPIRDVQSGLLVESTACTVLDGATTAALVRSRHLEWNDGNTWILDESSDLGRMARQRALGQILFGALTSLDVTDVLDVTNFAVDHLGIDQTFSSGELSEWIRWSAGRQSSQLLVEGLPVTDMLVDSAVGLSPATASTPNEAVEWLEGEISVLTSDEDPADVDASGYVSIKACD